MESADGEVEVISVEELLKRYDTEKKPATGSQGRADPASFIIESSDNSPPLWPPQLPARFAFLTHAFAQNATAPVMQTAAETAADAAALAALFEAAATF